MRSHIYSYWSHCKLFRRIHSHTLHTEFHFVANFRTMDMDSSDSIPESPLRTNMEFAVEMSCQGCESTVRKALENVAGIKVLSVDAAAERVLLESALPSTQVQQLIEQTGRQAVLRGVGAPGQQLGAAVVEFYGIGGVKGVTRFVQLARDRCIIDGTLDGLSPGRHGLAICENGDLSRGCESVGDHYNPEESCHGYPDSPHAHAGDLGNIDADAGGRAAFRLVNRRLNIWNVIGRSLVVHAREDDGRTPIDGNAGPKIACGIIARSAGIMENTKKICSCSGQTLWEERDNVKKQS
ncbi:copper chaperone for superoxide dismutase-like isoform X2 [Paramacrobiotus metropolitanus]|uniref:copper chaperone for superoxide dismutase-like isoform X2 n=1 Tax=Paramacrobiotus metropolitanus TaxID=2943436 RepID=UPI00244623DE|nr:copper chaperone for superoxide dismutase-like isoform X2 [Paramacrobiotus metropolitanus]